MNAPIPTSVEQPLATTAIPQQQPRTAGLAAAPATEPVEVPRATESDAGGNNELDVPEGVTVKGVGGWLLFFCVMISVIGPLVYINEIIDNPKDRLVMVFDLGLSAFSIYTGFTLWSVRPNALRLVRSYFIVMLVVASLAILGSFSTSLNSPTDQFPSQNPAVIGVRTLVGVAVWWSYFKKSHRVRATFGRNL